MASGERISYRGIELVNIRLLGGGDELSYFFRNLALGEYPDLDSAVELLFHNVDLLWWLFQIFSSVDQGTG